MIDFSSLALPYHLKAIISTYKTWPSPESDLGKLCVKYWSIFIYQIDSCNYSINHKDIFNQKINLFQKFVGI